MRGAFPAAVLLVAAVGMPLLVDARKGGDAAGVFTAAWVVAVLLGLVAAVLVRAWLPSGPPDPSGPSGPPGLSGPDAVRRATERALTVVVPLVVVVLVGSPWILSVSGAHARDTGVGTLVLLALSAVPLTVLLVAARAAAVRGRARAAGTPALVAVAVAVASSWVLVPAAGVLGAGFGWLLGVSAVAVALVARTRSMITRPVDA